MRVTPERGQSGAEAGTWAPAEERTAHLVRLVAIVAALVIVAWTGLIFVVPEVRFVVLNPKAKTGFEVTLAFLRLFTALVLALFPEEGARDRLRWVALGFAIQGLGGLGFGYLLPFIRGSGDLEAALYGSLLTRTIGTLAIAIGLVPPRARRLPDRLAAATMATFVALWIVVVLTAERLPALANVTSLAAAAAGSPSILRGLTAWHWTLSSLPVLVAGAAALGALRHYPGRTPPGWLALAMVLMAGSQLHTLFWPSAYSPILTTASLLRLAFTLVVAAGGFFELNRVAAERAAALEAERAAAAQAAELARVRADFTAMVAHELASPLAAVRRAAELLGTGPLDPTQARALATVETEVGLLEALVADARAGAAGRPDFEVSPFPVALDLLLADAVAYASTLPDEHPFTCTLGLRERVRADPERIAQVLHNLIHNAAKFSPPGSPIALEVTRTGPRVRLAVNDRGPGIPAEELPVVFARFGRGRDAMARGTEGAGLGLYLARRIVRAHGDELRVVSIPGEGATFWFELEVVG